jgi:hypothetical protein
LAAASAVSGKKRVVMAHTAAASAATRAMFPRPERAVRAAAGVGAAGVGARVGSSSASQEGHKESATRDRREWTKHHKRGPHRRYWTNGMGSYNGLASTNLVSCMYMSIDPEGNSWFCVRVVVLSRTPSLPGRECCSREAPTGSRYRCQRRRCWCCVRRPPPPPRPPAGLAAGAPPRTFRGRRAAGPRRPRRRVAPCASPVSPHLRWRNQNPYIWRRHRPRPERHSTGPDPASPVLTEPPLGTFDVDGTRGSNRPWPNQGGVVRVL